MIIILKTIAKLIKWFLGEGALIAIKIQNPAIEMCSCVHVTLLYIHMYRDWVT